MATESKGTSIKHTLVDKANSRIVITVAIASFLSVFSLVSAKTLFSQATYQNKVISAKKDSLKQVKANVEASSRLVAAYTAFNDTPQNVIGGSSTGEGGKDGPNSKIVLDALPSVYDFPALATSLEKVITDRGLTIQSIQGVDDQVVQQENKSSTNPVPVAIPFQFTVSGGYKPVQKLISDLQHSIRPFQVQTLTLGGSQDSMTLTITAQTYYQPAKNLNITEKVVK